MAIEAGDAIWRITGDIEGLNRAMLDAQTEVEQRFGAIANSVGNVLVGFGTVVTGSFAAIAAGGLKVADDMDVATGRMEAALGIPHERALELADVLREVYGDAFAESIEGAGEAITTVFTNLQGVIDPTNEQLKTMAEAGLAVQDTWGVDVAETMQAVTALMQNFGLTTDEAMDFVVGGMQGGLNASEDFLDSITEYSVQFGDAGADAGQFFSLLDTGLAQGMLGTDKAADVFKEFTIKIREGGSAVEESLNNIGIDSDAMFKGISDGSISSVDAFGMVLDGVRNVDDKMIQFQASTALLGTQFEDLGTSGAFALDLQGTKIEDLAGSTDKLNAQYLTLGTTLEGLKRKFLLALEPIGRELAEVLQKHMPQIQAGFERLIDLAPAFGKVFSTALDVFLTSILPVIESVVNFAAEHENLTAVAIAVTGAMAGLAIPLGIILKTLGPLAAGMKLLGGLKGIGAVTTGVTALSGATGTGGVLAGLSSALGGAGLTGTLAAGGALALGALATGAAIGVITVKMIESSDAAVALRDSNDSLSAAQQRFVESLQEKGVAIDDDIFKIQSHTDAILEANSREKTDQESLAIAIFEHFADREATLDEFARVRNLMLNEGVDAQGAAFLTIQGLTGEQVEFMKSAGAEENQAFLENSDFRRITNQELIDEIVSSNKDRRDKNIATWQDESRAAVEIAEGTLNDTRGFVEQWSFEILEGLKAFARGIGDLFSPGNFFGSPNASGGVLGMGSGGVFGGYSHGGAPSGSEVSIVGERGPEFIVGGRGDRVITHQDSMAAIREVVSSMVGGSNGGGQGSEVNVTIGNITIASDQDAIEVGDIIGGQISNHMRLGGATT